MAEHTKGKANSIIRDAIGQGLRFEDGNIVLPSGKIARATKTKAGYFRISLGTERHRRSFTRARLVCWLVHGPPPEESAQVDQINRDRGDDRPENLRWATATENALNISDESRERSRAAMRRNRVTLRGESHPAAKLSDDDVRMIREMAGDGISQYAIAHRLGVSQPCVSRIIRSERRIA